MVLQVVHAGTGPFATIDHVIDQSLLIDLYREVINKVEDDYHVTKRTVSHTKPPKLADIQRICEDMKKQGWLIFKKGRSKPKVDSHLEQGWAMLNRSSTHGIADDTSEDMAEITVYDVTGEDIGV
jgi:hypothetical protein